jgi:hypothetical protein
MRTRKIQRKKKYHEKDSINPRNQLLWTGHVAIPARSDKNFNPSGRDEYQHLPCGRLRFAGLCSDVARVQKAHYQQLSKGKSRFLSALVLFNRASSILGMAG